MNGLKLSINKSPLLYSISKFDKPFDYEEMAQSIYNLRSNLFIKSDIELEIEASPIYSSERALFHIFLYLFEKEYIKKSGEKYRIDLSKFQQIEEELLNNIKEIFGQEKANEFMIIVKN